ARSRRSHGRARRIGTTVASGCASPDCPGGVSCTLGEGVAMRLGLALIGIGWLHLLAFGACWWLTVGVGYHSAPGYLAIWAAELLGTGAILRAAGPWPTDARGRFVARVWLAYLALGLNLCTMNGLRGHGMFELFPAMASLASFGFLVMAMAVDGRFFAAVLAMFAAGLAMAAWHQHAYLAFAVAWWLVLNGIGWTLRREAVIASSATAG
ncbi:MAG: hypothetical protein K2W96_16095, partial [Gemmataceae bacterium]|nr:hypothetical protein [Gemmataceae bacterium]